ncbi:zinc ABC transporter permease [Anaerocolumna cellulosilytica]|uniref:Zinc ABC transporter permease n=1 Tax=Anaerocolumna cellulosilytica TaxID=433286 RepID=A0A6S6R341_9FIRM|nr:metal ABC transporter permease [Anaerocolumna cellulosilytica]MBB5196658.1 manganese/zinc/iron transport system permease protein [Anaerocolumna cellulosilytica]BCJ93922.1 zinc ABC transporter permease [Anaerocolumna cellulosilytica]
MSPQLEILLIAITVAVACSLPGAFLVLRKMSMMSDSITHTILLGIVLAFFLTHDLSSPFLIAGAALIGLATVWLTETLNRTKLLSEDAAIGIVFPLLFSIAIILIAKYAGSVHLDTDSVLLGELAFAPFNRLIIFGYDIGAKAIYSTMALLLINLVFLIIFFKELKVVTFDPILAAVLGFSPTLLHYSLMFLVSMTTVGAFEAVGSVLVVAFMIGPPVTAYLLTDDLKHMLLLSALIGMVNAILGYYLAVVFDVSISGSMSVMTGLVFFLVFIIAPHRGLISSLRRRSRQKLEFGKKTLLFHLYNHTVTENEKQDTSPHALTAHFHWDKALADKIIGILLKEENIFIEDEVVKITEKGQKQSKMDYESLFAE